LIFEEACGKDCSKRILQTQSSCVKVIQVDAIVMQVVFFGETLLF